MHGLLARPRRIGLDQPLQQGHQVFRQAPPVLSQQPRPTAPLVDLTTATTLAPVRDAFNAHEAEARFLTLLSPT